MANTYTQIYLQVVFAVEGRQSLIRKQNKEELHKYLTGIVREREQKLLAVHCMPDHTHILIGLRPSMALSDLVHDVKIGSANFVNRKAWVVVSVGRRVLEHSHMAIPSSLELFDTFKTRNSITPN